MLQVAEQLLGPPQYTVPLILALEYAREHRDTLERTFEAVVQIDNKDGLLRPGMKIRAKIFTGPRPWGRLVLQSALDLLSLDFRFLRL